MAYRDYSTANGLIVSKGSDGDFKTIASALAAAVSGQTIFIRTGVYVENITLVSGVNLNSFPTDSYSQNVTIQGKLTGPSSGTVGLSGLYFVNASDYIFDISGTPNINLINCFININGHDGIRITGAADFRMFQCLGNMASSHSFFAITNTDTAFIFTGLNIQECQLSNGSSITTASTISGGNVIVHASEIYFPITSSGTASVYVTSSKLDCSSINATALTIGGSGANQVSNSVIKSGSASALSIGGTATITQCSVSSSNVNAITGAGTIKYGDIDFTSTSSTINTNTQTSLTSQMGALNLRTPLTGANGGTGTANTGLTINLASGGTGKLLTSDSSGNGTWAAAPSSGFTTVNIQTFTGNGTYTPTANMKYCIIECVGGGGGGGGSAISLPNFYTSGGGGGGGGYARLKASAATIGASKAVTVGAAGSAGSAGNNAGGSGGDTSVGVLCIGKGGSGGSGSSGSANASGGAGGVAGTGDFTFPGQSGRVGPLEGTTSIVGSTSAGGASYFGYGATETTTAGTTTGGAGQNYGGGGGGGITVGSGTTVAGGAGAAGVVIITEYI